MPITIVPAIMPMKKGRDLRYAPLPPKRVTPTFSSQPIRKLAANHREMIVPQT